MIIQWVRHRYRKAARDYEEGGVIAVMVGVLSDQAPEAEGDIVTTANAAFARTVTTADATFGRVVTTEPAVFARTITTSDGER